MRVISGHDFLPCLGLSDTHVIRRTNQPLSATNDAETIDEATRDGCCCCCCAGRMIINLRQSLAVSLLRCEITVGPIGSKRDQTFAPRTSVPLVRVTVWYGDVRHPDFRRDRCPGQGAVMPCSWEGSRRSGMFIHLRAGGLRK